MLAACSRTPEARDVPTITYRGLKMSLPKDSATEHAPPAAWLIVGNEVVPATYGSFTTRMHADAPPPQMRPDLATITLPAAVRATVIISAEAITAFQAHVRPWTADPAPSADTSTIRTLNTERTSDGGLTVFTLEPIPDAADQLLDVMITFSVAYQPALGAEGLAQYFWRLNSPK